MVKQEKDESRLLLNNIYPNEPKARNSDKIKVAESSLLLNNNVVTSRKELENGHIQIQTEHEAKDDSKKALIRYTYIIGSDLFIIKKRS